MKMIAIYFLSLLQFQSVSLQYLTLYFDLNALTHLNALVSNAQRDSIAQNFLLLRDHPK